MRLLTLLILTLIILAAPIHAQTPTPGDANGDGLVNEADYTIWLNHYTANTTNGSTDGDFSGDQKVDGVDYVIWWRNYGTNTTTSTPKPTPQPTINEDTPTPIPTLACSGSGYSCVNTGTCAGTVMTQITCPDSHQVCCYVQSNL